MTPSQQSTVDSLIAAFEAANNVEQSLETARHSQDGAVAALSQQVADLQADNAAQLAQIADLTAGANQNAVDRDAAIAERDAAISERNSLRNSINAFLAAFGLSLPN